MRWFTPAAVLLTAWGALAFGAEYPWAYAPLLVFGATVGLLGLAAPAPAAGRFPAAVALGLGVVAAAAALQVVPLPEPVVARLSPARAAHDWPALYAAALPSAPAPPAAGAASSTISIEPSRTVLGLAFAGGLSLLFLGAARALGAVRPSGLARGLIVLGVVVALAGIVQAAGGGPAVYGFWYPRKAETPTAPFINANHFAGWMLMALSVAVGYLGGGAARALRGARPDWRGLTGWFGSREAAEIVLAGFAALVMALSIFVTRSVSGMACLAAALGAAAVCAFRRQVGRRRLLMPAALAAVLGAAVLWAGVEAVGGEIGATWATAFDAGGRVGIWRDTLRIVGDFPLAGTGLNTYGIAMLAYQTHGVDVRAVEAHNDYLQLAAEGGLLLGVPVVVAAGVFAREVRRRFREARDDTRTWWLRVGAVTGIAAVALQELVDFSLQMPGNAVLFVLLMAMAAHRRAAAPTPAARGDGNAAPHRDTSPPRSGRHHGRTNGHAWLSALDG